MVDGDIVKESTGPNPYAISHDQMGINGPTPRGRLGQCGEINLFAGLKHVVQQARIVVDAAIDALSEVGEDRRLPRMWRGRHQLTEAREMAALPRTNGGQLAH